MSVYFNDDESFDVTIIPLIELPIEDIGALLKQPNNLPVVNFNDDATKNSNIYSVVIKATGTIGCYFSLIPASNSINLYSRLKFVFPPFIFATACVPVRLL